MALTLYSKVKHLFMNQEIFVYVTKQAVQYAGMFNDKTSSY